MEQQDFHQAPDAAARMAGWPAKKLFTRLGLIFAATLLLMQVVQIFLFAILQQKAPDFLNSVWGNWILAGVSMYVFCLPVYLLLMRRVPKQPALGTKTPFSGSQVFVLFVICLSTTYLGNYISIAINAGLAAIKGAPITNPLEFTGDGSLLATVLFGVILSPIVEEIIFRKVLIDRLEQYGEGLCILASGWFFGLYHGNLSQLIYAFALGCIFAFVYVRSGRLRYSSLLHVAINACGLVIFPQIVAAGNLASTLLIGLILITAIIAGVVLFCKHVKKIRLYPGSSGLTSGQKCRLLMLNPGSIVYELLILGLITLTVLA